MGYGNDHFSGAVAKWIDDGWLPIGGRIVEFGSQEFYGDQSEARRSVRQFLRDRGLSATAIQAAVPDDKPVSIAEVYGALGIDYLAIDVDEERGSRFSTAGRSCSPWAATRGQMPGASSPRVYWQPRFRRSWRGPISRGVGRAWEWRSATARVLAGSVPQ
jgi:hypothetical protein